MSTFSKFEDTDSDDDISLGRSKRQRGGRINCPYCNEQHFATVPCANAPAYRPGQRLQMPSAGVSQNAPDLPPPLPPVDPPDDDGLFLGALWNEIPRPVRPNEQPGQFIRFGDYNEEVPRQEVEFDDRIDGDIEDPVAPDAIEDEIPVEGLQWVPHQIRPNPIRRNLLDPQGHLNQFPKPVFQGGPGHAFDIPAQHLSGETAFTPAQYFMLLWDQDSDGETGIVNKFLRTMNRYGVHYYGNRPGQPWQPIRIQELYRFFALIMYGGVVKVPQFRQLWATKAPYSHLYGRDIVKAAMTQNRFRELWRCFHYLDATEFTEAERNEARRRDGFWSTSDFLADLNKRFEGYYQPGQYVDVDEMCIFLKAVIPAGCTTPTSLTGTT